MWNNPCDVPWVVYIETARPAALEALVAIACFDIGDVLRFIFRPAGLRSGRHGGRPRKGRHGRKAKGIRARLARKLPPFARLQQRKLTQGVKNLWIIDGVGQRLLWWWLIADVSTGFLYNWTSMIYKTEKCQMALAPGATLWSGNTQVFIPLFGFSQVTYNAEDYQRGNAFIFAQVYSFGAGEWLLVASVTVHNGFPSSIGAEMRIRVQDLTGTWFIFGGETRIPANSSGSVMVTGNISGGASGWTEMRIDGGALIGEDAAFYIQGKPTEIPPPVKFKCPIPFFDS